ncbi:MAG: rRNA pseudouridine synthase [Oscillospiraceae bacterium]|nr:rRNA pseudouridine synthase [Oscillospiraceae bacterium]
MNKDKERLQKLIAESGHCSRRAAEELIKAGAVKVNGRAVRIGDKASKSDIVTVMGRRLEFSRKIRYIKLYKPRGYTSSLADSHSKKLITELLKGVEERVYPVGRLDKDSEGLLLLTNDGDFANRITHPRLQIKKKYRVTLPHVIPEEIIERLCAGVNIGEDGAREMTAPCEINVVVSEKATGDKKARTVLEIAITEGKNRQIRRMCSAVGLEVARLKRTSVGGVKLGMLKPGEHLDLTEKELKILGQATEKKYTPPRTPTKGKKL